MHAQDKVVSSIVYDLTQKFVIEKEKTIVQPVASRTKVISYDNYKIVKKDEVRKIEELIIPIVPGTPLQGTEIGVPSDSASDLGGSGGNTDSSFSDTFSTASVDVLPAFPGGEDAMLKYLSKYIRYPDTAREYSITGRVYVSFVIDENGKVTEIKIMRGLGYGTEEEVVRVVGKMPDWTPGKYNGRSVKTAFIMPVLFSLK
jgi:protein TonB